MDLHTDAQELADICEDLTDASNTHPGIRLITAGLLAIAADDSLDLAATQLILAQLSGGTDTNVIAGIGSAIAHLSSTANPALNHLPDDQAKEITRLGYLARLALQDPDLTRNTSEALARLDHAERRCPAVTDEKRKELRDKVRETNKQSNNRPR